MRRLMPPSKTCADRSAGRRQTTEQEETDLDDKVPSDASLIRRRIHDIPLHPMRPLQLVIQRHQTPRGLGIVADLDELHPELGEREPALVQPVGEGGQGVGEGVGVVGLAVGDYDQVERFEGRGAVGFGLLEPVEAACTLSS